MSFWTLIENAPEEARYWMPIFYYRDPVTGAYTPYSPGYLLDIPQSWLCPLSAGEGIMVDYRCVIYDSAHDVIGTRDLYNIIVIDGKEFTYNWEERKGVSPWMILAPVGILAVVGIASVIKKKKTRR